MEKRVRMRKCKEPTRFTLTQRKKKDNLLQTKISSNRITIVPGFLRYGVKSEVARKEEGENKNHENILNGNLHSLFFTKKSPEIHLVRRSSRISQKSSTRFSGIKTKRGRKFRNSEKYTDKPQTSNGEVEEVLSNDLTSVPEETEQDNSKSLFKQIVSSQAFSASSSFLKSLLSKKVEAIPKDFNQNLLENIEIHTKVDATDDIRRRIFKEIERVNDILSGKSDTIETNLKKMMYDNCDNEQSVPELLFSKEEWRYNTPPSQKLNMTLYEETSIQPAVFCNDGTVRNIYELKKDVDAKLINHVNPASIEVDNRYMEQIARFDKENRPWKEISWHDEKKRDDTKNFNFNPEYINQYHQEHLATIHARPKKTVKRLRFADTLSRNEILLRDRQLLKPSTSSRQDQDPFESDVDFTISNYFTDDSSVESPLSHCKLLPRMNIHKYLGEKRHLFTSLDMSDDD